MHSLNKKLEQIKKANWEGKKPYYAEEAREATISILPDLKVAPAKFKAHPQKPGTYLAHPTTIRAVKKDMLLGGSDFSEFSNLRPCPSCHKELDLQFWNFCPYCESGLERAG